MKGEYNMDIPNDLIYKDVELVHEFDKKTYHKIYDQEVIRFSLVFNLSPSTPENEYKWDNKYELRTVSGIHIYCEDFFAMHAEVTVKLSYDLCCSEESKKHYIGTLKKLFNGQIPEKVCIITNLNQQPVAMGNMVTDQFMYIQGEPKIVNKKYILKSILSSIHVE